MEKVFQSVEEVLTDEQFQAWYFKSDPAKIKAWESWMSQHPSQQEMVDAAVSCMGMMTVREREISEEQVTAATDRLMSAVGKSTPVRRLQPSRRRWGWSAAAAIVLLAAGTYLWTSLKKQSSVETAYGQLSTQQLPDGSEVVLNANSSISYSSDWEESKEREVWIKGEAFFKVKKTAAKTRFVVHTSQLDIVVTGTQFNVTSRADKSSVMLTEGSVIIRTKDGEETLMKPGDFIELFNSQLERKAVKEETVLAWKEKKIVFDNTSLADVVSQIKEHYGQEIVIMDDALARRTITAIMPNDNLDVLLKSLEATLDFKVVRKDGRIMITTP